MLVMVMLLMVRLVWSLEYLALGGMVRRDCVQHGVHGVLEHLCRLLAALLIVSVSVLPKNLMLEIFVHVSRSLKYTHQAS